MNSSANQIKHLTDYNPKMSTNYKTNYSYVLINDFDKIKTQMYCIYV